MMNINTIETETNEIELELAQLLQDIPEAPENWALEDFDDVLSNAGYSIH